MNILQQIKAAASKDCPLCKSIRLSLENYPTDILQILIYHRLHFHMDPGAAVRSFRLLVSEFVDWNEVRISPIREIQAQLNKGDNSLDLSVFIKDLLEFVHSRHQKISIEPLGEENITEIRRYLKQIRGMDATGIDLILMLRKTHPIVPLSASMERLLLELGLVNEGDSRDRREKSLFELVGPESALAFHHLLLDHCRRDVELGDTPYESTQEILLGFSREHGKKGHKKSRGRSSTTGSRSSKKGKSSSSKKSQKKAKKSKTKTKTKA